MENSKHANYKKKIETKHLIVCKRHNFKGKD